MLFRVSPLPYAIAMTDDGPMVMAGLWETWKSLTSGEEIVTCTVLTCGPNKSVGKFMIACR
jgi:putative SOS response-associated peptidase YedK